MYMSYILVNQHNNVINWSLNQLDMLIFLKIKCWNNGIARKVRRKFLARGDKSYHLDGGERPWWGDDPILGSPGHPETDQKNYLDAPLIGQLGSTWIRCKELLKLMMINNWWIINTFTKRCVTPDSWVISTKKASLMKFNPSPRGFRLKDRSPASWSTSLVTCNRIHENLEWSLWARKDKRNS